MTPVQDEALLEMWIGRTRRMCGYRDEALDFLRRAASQLPVSEADLALVCRLWAVADEHDEILCGALTQFDSDLFDPVGDLDITRGVETRPIAGSEPQTVFLCTWAMVDPDDMRVSCILFGEQTTGTIGLEVRDHHDISTAIPFPIADPDELYGTLSDIFFRLAAGV